MMEILTINQDKNKIDGVQVRFEVGVHMKVSKGWMRQQQQKSWRTTFFLGFTKQIKCQYEKILKYTSLFVLEG